MQTHLLKILTIFCLSLVGACSTTNPNSDSSKPHHTPTGFKNIYSEGTGSFGKFLIWQWKWLGKAIRQPTADLSPAAADLQAIGAPKEAQVTWIGQASVLV